MIEYFYDHVKSELSSLGIIWRRLGRDLLSVGRSSESDIPIGRGEDSQLSDAASVSVSCTHAELFFMGDSLCVRDVGSRNGTRYLPRGDETRSTSLEPHVWQPLQEGDALVFGEGYKLTFR